MRIPGFVIGCVAAAILVLAGAAAAERGTIWLTADIKSPKGRAEIRLPLEWLASTRTSERPTLRVGGVRLDCLELWRKYESLPAGESRDVEDGMTKEGEHYVVRVASDIPAAKPADGKVRILNRDESGKDTEVGFPLSFAKVLDGITNLVPNWIDDDEAKELESDGLSLSGDIEFTRLADYGPFTALDARDAKSRVRIRIE
jgi:hypothetical protein